MSLPMSCLKLCEEWKVFLVMIRGESESTKLLLIQELGMINLECDGG